MVGGRHEAEEFEHALRASWLGVPVKGRQGSLVETAQELRRLSGAVPEPPGGLAPGRLRFLAEAARRRGALERPQSRPAWAFRLVAALGAVALLLGAVFGVGQAAATSLPGQPLYGVKLIGEQLRLAVAFQPTAKVTVALDLAEERMDEIVEMLGAGRELDARVSERAALQLDRALAAAARLANSSASLALKRLAEAIWQRETALRRAAGEAPVPLQKLLREMERVREEAHRGQGDPEGLRQRLRHGMPAEPTDAPRGPATPGPWPARTGEAPSPGADPSPSRTPPSTSRLSQPVGASEMPDWTPDPSRTLRPTRQPTPTPLRTATSEPTGPPHGPMTPDPGGSETPKAGGTPSPDPGSGGGGGRP